MKKYIALFLCIIISVSLIGCGKEVPPKDEITLLCSGEYVTEELLKEFKDAYDVTVNVTRLESETEISETLKANPIGYDIVIASDYTINELRTLNLLQPMDKSQLKNAKNVDPAYSNFYFDPKNEYTIPLNVAAVLAVYNKKTCPVPVKSYADLLNPALQGKIVFLNNSNILAGISNLYLGYNPVSVENLSALKETMSAFAKNTYAVHDDQTQYILANGEAVAGVMFNPQIAEAVSQNPDLEIVYPEEGFIMAADAIAYCSQEEPNISAIKFVDFMLEDKILAKIVQNLNGCPTTKGAAKYMDKTYAQTPGNILDPSKITSVHFFYKVAPEIQREFDNMYIDVFRPHLLKLQQYYIEQAAIAEMEKEAAEAAKQVATANAQ